MIHPPVSIPPPSFASHALRLLQNVQHGISLAELVYTTHEHWPLRPGQKIHAHPTLRISVLDASFNPPTLAHLALANSLPPPSHQCTAASSVSTEPYDARMLLLSVRNVDKFLKPGDPTLVQRLEMMYLLTHDIPSTDTTESSGKSLQMGSNTAIAIIDEPMFVGKSTLLVRFLQTRLATVAKLSNCPDSRSDEPRNANERDAPCPFPSPKLTFLLGFDTLVRLFSPKYYPSEQAMIHMLRKFLSPDQEGCRIVCAYRGGASADNALQDKTFEITHEFITSDRIAFINIGTEEQAYSSSEARARFAAGDGTWKRLVIDTIANYIIKHGIYSGSESKTIKESIPVL